MAGEVRGKVLWRVVSLAVTALVTAGLLGCGRGGRPDAKTRIDFSDIPRIRKALDKFKKDCGRYPTTAEGLKVLVDKPASPDIAAKWKGPYLDDPEQLKDPWDNTYLYEYHEKKVRRGAKVVKEPVFKVWSAGPDGQKGTGDDYPTEALRARTK